MKKILMCLLFFIPVLCFSDTVISQEKLIETLNLDFKKAPVYKKYKEVYARKAIEGEIIKTYTKDGLETQNVAKEGDYVVKNNTEAKEMYILSEKKFNERYKYKSDLDNEWKVYSPLGRIKALKVNGKIFKVFKIKEKEFYILTSWGEKMIVKRNDFLVAPLNYNEVYRIANKEFFETYEKEK